MAQHDPLSLLLSFDVGADEEWLCHYPLAGNPLQEALPAEAVWNEICIDCDGSGQAWINTHRNRNRPRFRFHL